MTSTDVQARVVRSPGVKYWLASISTGSFDVRAEVGADVPDVSVASTSGCWCLVQGLIYGLPEVGEGHATAEQVLQAYALLGERLLDHVGGFFSFVIADATHRRILAARDPLGVYPLFFSSLHGSWLFSPSASTLTAQPDVSAEVNRAALADHLRHQWPRPEETFFEAVNRVLPGHARRVTDGATASWRYWEPVRLGRDPHWIDEADLGQFDVLLDDAVRRMLALGRAGIYLSGGLDSVSVGALASDHARRDGLPLPLALSLVFPEPYSEHAVQTRVAAQLGLPQLLVDLEPALGEGGLVRAAMRSSWLSSPIQNPWLPAYRELARRARARDCEVILTGSGGDEWLAVTPLYAADLVRTLRLGELFRLAANLQRSYNLSVFPLARNMVWRFGLRPVLASERNRVMQRVAPARLAARQIESRRNALDRRPWLAPDPELRRELLDRDEEAVLRMANEEEPPPIGGLREYFRDGRKALTHPLVSMELEEVFEYSRDIGVRLLHPYWDTRLVEFLHATPPRLLNRGGRSKGLVRSMLARRFPDLGFERQRKIVVSSMFGSSLAAQAPAAWRELGGARALADAGIVDPVAAAALVEGRVSTASPAVDRTGVVWELLTVEPWLRAQT